MPAAGASRSCRSCTSVAQLRARWGRDGARTILDACGTKVFLPGSSDPETLEMASRLSGQVAARERGAGHDTRHPVMTEDMIRQLPARRDGTGYAFVLRNGLSPVIGRPPVIWRDRTARRLARRAQQATQPTVLPEAIPARCTPGAESAAAAWSDEAAEDALLAAAGRNGYVAGHSAAAARSAIRSGLRNGLRSPRPLPDFTSRPALHAPERGRAPEQMGPGAGEQARARPPAAARKSPAASDRRGSVSSARPAGTSSRDGPTGTPSEIGDSVAATLRAAGFKPSGQGHGSPDEPEGFVLQRSPDGRIVIQHTAIAQPAGGVPPWDRAGQMLDRYARNLRGAGYDITRSDPASLTVRGPSPSPHARMGRIKAAPTRITGPWLTGRPPPRTLPAVQGISSAPAGSPTGPPHSTRPALSCGSGTAPRSTPTASSTRQRPPELRAIRRGHTSSSGTPPGWTRA